MKRDTIKKVKNMIWNAAFLFTLLLFFMSPYVFAAENEEAENKTKAAVISSRTSEDAVYVYIGGVSDITSGTTVQIGNTMCKDIQVAGIAGMGMNIKTTILFDNSISLSKAWGKQAKELIKGIIEQHLDGEEFKITTFAKELSVISDYSSDYETLTAAVDEIEFVNQSSYLSDILYDMLSEASNSAEANYHRIIIITDGADDQDIKYTQTEITELLKNSGTVIHTVGAKTANNNSLLENLFSYSRQTQGKYHLVDGNTDAESVRNSIDEDYTLYCLKLIPESSVQDGGKKEAKFQLNTSEGEVILTASLKMPFGEVKEQKTEPETAAEEPKEEIRKTEPAKQELPSISVEPPKEETKTAEEKANIPIWVIIVVSAVAAGIILIAIIILILSKKKKKKKNEVIISQQNNPPVLQSAEIDPAGTMQNGTRQSGGNTLRLGQNSQKKSGNTMRLPTGAGQPINQSFVILTDINNPQKSFRVPIETRIVIGREQGDIILGFDSAVSYTHCEIVKKGNLYYVNDLKSSNGTYYGNTRVYGETPIMNGGILEIGAAKYKITIEN